MLFTKLFSSQLDPYPIIKLPIKYSYLNPAILSENSKETWAAYKKWFLNIKDERIIELALEIQRTSDYSGWSADHTIESIASLSAWFPKVIGSRRPTSAEKAWILQNVPHGPGRNMSLKYQLNEKTLSLCFDVGIYIGETVIKHNPTLKWKQLQGQHLWAGMLAITGELRHDPSFKPQKNFPREPFSMVRAVAIQIIEGVQIASVQDVFNIIYRTYENKI